MKLQGKNSLCLFNIIDDKIIRPHNHKLLLDYNEALTQDFDRSKYEKESFTGIGGGGMDILPVPKEDDFFLFPFRHISKTVVGSGTFKSTDFTEGNILKRSVRLLTNSKAYENHRMIVGNEIGWVGDAKYSKGYVNPKGEEVPDGIDAPFVIDGIIHPILIRKMMAPIPYVDSASVTVIFEWEASHEFDNEFDFFFHLGETIDDEEVRRIVKNIIEYHESSLVAFGADPFAKMLDENGQVADIDKGQAFSKDMGDVGLAMEKYSKDRKYFIFDCLDCEKLLSLSEATIQFEKVDQNKIAMNKELLDFLAKQFGCTTEEIEKGTFDLAKAKGFKIVTEANFTSLTASADKVEGLETDISNLKKEVDTSKELTAELALIKVDELKDLKAEQIIAFAKVGKSISGEDNLKELTVETIVNYAKSGLSAFENVKSLAEKTYLAFAGKEKDDEVLEEIKSETSFDKLTRNLKMWGGKVVAQYGASCKDCSSENITFKSTATETPEKNENQDDRKSLAEQSQEANYEEGK